ncbi:MAG TPA: class I lanthipeptide [Mycobacteriales bacterium]|jgi:hypothetical protein
MRRSLSLKRETLTALSDDQMSSVQGGSHLCGVTHGPSFDQSCPTPTLPINECVQDMTIRVCPTGPYMCA